MDLNELNQNSIHDLNGTRYKVTSFFSQDNKIYIELEDSEDVNLSTD